MSFTYGGEPKTNQVDAIRFLTGDTDATEFFLHDGEIEYLTELWRNQSGSSPYLVAAYACDAISAKLARESTVSSDGQSFSLDGLMDKFMRLAAQLRQQHKDLFVGMGDIYVGGMDAHEQPDPTVKPLAFGTGMHDHLEAGNQDYGDRISGPEFGQWGEYTP